MTAVITEPDVATKRGPVNSVTSDDRRVYIHPVTGERFLSVTTALQVIAKPFLPGWYADLAAAAAIDNLAELIDLAGVQRCNGGIKRCGTCPLCWLSGTAPRTRDAAADRGTRFHHVAEQYALTGEIIPHDPDVAPLVTQFLRFVEIHKVRFHAAEVTVLDRRHWVAGTLDCIIECGWMPRKHRDLIGVPVTGDYKSGASIYSDAALQLSEYRNAQSVMLPDGSELPMPDTDPETGLVIQIRPDDFWVRPAAIGPAVHEKFLRALALYRDLHEPDIDLIGRAMCKPRPPKPTTTPAAAAA